MIFGHVNIDNLIAIVTGVISIAVGIGILKWRAEFDRAAAQIQRGLGPIGERIARQPRGRWTVIGAVGFIALGVFVLGLGLLAKLTH